VKTRGEDGKHEGRVIGKEYRPEGNTAEGKTARMREELSGRNTLRRRAGRHETENESNILLECRLRGLTQEDGGGSEGDYVTKPAENLEGNVTRGS
jgi:hypothetical protein